MSEGSVFVRADGRACAKYRDAKGKDRYLYGKNKQEVRRKLRQALKDRDDGIASWASGKLTVSAFLDSWLEDMQDAVSKRTWLEHKSIVRRHISPTIGTKKLAKLTPDDVRGLYRSKARAGLKPPRVRRVHVTLSRALKDAVRFGYIRHNPATLVAPPREQQREITVLPPEQVKRLFAAARGDRLECAYVLPAACALRIGECLALRWEDVDLEAGTLKIRRTVWRNRIQPTKNKSSTRTIQLPGIALEALRRQQNGHQGEGWLFPTKHGNPVDASNLHPQWKRLLRKAGLPETTRYHDLRHSAASLLLSQGVPVPAVSHYLGHANSGITLKVYAHMVDGMGGMAAQGMNAVLG